MYPYAVENTRERLLELLVRHSFQQNADPVFTLASGRKSRYYINCKKTTFMPEAMPLLGGLFFERIKAVERRDGDHIDAVGGLTLGADPIAYAIAYHSALQGMPIRAFSVRKEPKDHGAQKWVEGFEQTGARVAIIEDVVTTGASTMRAIERSVGSGLVVARVLCLVDRNEGGSEAVAAAGYRVEPMFLREDVEDA